MGRQNVFSLFSYCMRLTVSWSWVCHPQQLMSQLCCNKLTRIGCLRPSRHIFDILIMSQPLLSKSLPVLQLPYHPVRYNIGTDSIIW
jgi:hypothetical protein